MHRITQEERHYTLRSDDRQEWDIWVAYSHDDLHRFNKKARAELIKRDINGQLFDRYRLDGAEYGVDILPHDTEWQKPESDADRLFPSAEVWDKKFLPGYVPHRTDGPAIVRNRNRNTKHLEAYYQHGILHREDGPAVVQYAAKASSRGYVRLAEWYTKAERHRIDGPSMIFVSPSEKQEWWYLFNTIHRTTGPAVEKIGWDMKPRYFMHGAIISEDQFKWVNDNTNPVKRSEKFLQLAISEPEISILHHMKRTLEFEGVSKKAMSKLFA